MSHLVEVYAKDLGVKVGNAEITDHFYPIVQNSYVVVSKTTPLQCHQYDYWPVVMSLIDPILKKFRISKIELSEKDNLTPKQRNHVIKNSKMYFGVLSHFSQLASIYNTPSVSLVSNVYPENCKPLKNAVVLSPDFSDKKPSFSVNEAQKRINEIKPEVIAQAILDKLCIKEKIKFKTVKIGKHFQNNCIEVVPDFFAFSPELNGKLINLLADENFNEDYIVKWSQICKLNLILDREISDEMINAIRPNTEQIVFKLKNLDVDLNKFFKKIVKSKIKLQVIVEDESILNDARFKYFDFHVVPEEKVEDLSNLNLDDVKYFSNKFFVTNKKTFKSNFSAKRLDNSNKFVYDEFSSKELESLYLYE